MRLGILYTKDRHDRIYEWRRAEKGWYCRTAWAEHGYELPPASVEDTAYAKSIDRLLLLFGAIYYSRSVADGQVTR